MVIQDHLAALSVPFHFNCFLFTVSLYRLYENLNFNHNLLLNELKIGTSRGSVSKKIVFSVSFYIVLSRAIF